jgi:hypothetical protein
VKLVKAMPMPDTTQAQALRPVSSGGAWSQVCKYLYFFYSTELILLALYVQLLFMANSAPFVARTHAFDHPCSPPACCLFP